MAGIALNSREPATPMTIPTALPSADRMKPSITSAPMIRCLDQPMAERMPISRVRSSTAISSVFSTISTPINSATQAMADDTALSSPIRLSFCSAPPLPVTVNWPKPSMALAMRSASPLSPGWSSLTDMKVTAPVRKVTSCRSASSTMTALRLMIEE